MFDGHYLERNNKLIKNIIDFYGLKFFYYKKIIDNGAAYADISGALSRLGADITAVDARQEHLKIISKKFPNIKVVKADLDRGWPFKNKHFDIVLDLDLICHLSKYEEHLRDICASTTHLVLETAVCDSEDPNKVVVTTENKNNYDLSVNGVSSRPTSAYIERILQECGMNFKRMDSAKFNTNLYSYDWQPKNNDECNVNKRRIWFAVKNSSPMQFAKPSAPVPPPPSQPPLQVIQPEPYRSYVVNPNMQIVSGDKRFVIVIPSYNNSRWCEQNIISTINQNYAKYRVIFTDDCSHDNTFEKVQNTVNASNKKNQFTLIKNSVRKGALENLYNMIHSCADDEIILTLDGDDWFPDERVLSRLNEIYSDKNVWLTYGQYQNYPDKNIGVSSPYPQHIINGNAFRQYQWCASHLRTFYTWLFKKINKEDLLWNGKFYPMTWDFAMMFPMLEMSQNNSKFVSDILYTYNLENPINDHKVNVAMQQQLDKHIRSLRSYSKVNMVVVNKQKIGLLVIATGKYDRFIQGLIDSADKFFLKDCEVTYYLFTDKQVHYNSIRKIVTIPIEHKGFPHASMDRFKHFINNKEKLTNEDYLYYVDVDSLFVDNIGTDILGNLVGVQHCGYFNTSGPVEDNRDSCLFVDQNSKYKNYFGGGFSGGKRDDYLQLAQRCYDMTETDVSKGIIPKHHDETVINRYFLDNEPNIILNPSYHFPQSNHEHYRRIWNGHNFQPKILLLDKDHQEVRN